MSASFGKTELVDVVAEKMNVSRVRADAAITAVVAAIADTLCDHSDEKGTVVSLKNFGAFHIRHLAERQGRNPKTGEAMTIPASKRLTFVPSKTLKQRLNGGGK